MTARRRALLRDLTDVAGQLADDELHVLLTIAVRAWIGQATYGCLDLRHDRRDLRHEGLEELCDGCFYIAASLLQRRRLGHCTSRKRSHG